MSVQTGAIALVSWLMLFLLFSLSSIYGSYTFGGSYDLAKTLLPTGEEVGFRLALIST
jgi:hypothetical protein